MEYPKKIPAIKVSQPFGDFFITKLPASVLLEVTFSDPLRVRERYSDTYSVQGNQRELNISRLKEIGLHIDSVDLAFPNSIILSANYYEDGTSVLDVNERWTIESNNEGCYSLTIPKQMKLASIIDGQHRVDAFNYASRERLNVELLCAVYLDLPDTYQAYLFATINYYQKPVPKSLAYELFGSSIEMENPESWSPEKTAISITRKLNTLPDSPFYNHIFISAQQDDLFQDKIIDWGVSTATVVDGIMKLYSVNPNRDKALMHKEFKNERNRNILSDDNSPLRQFYLDCNDFLIFKAVSNFFSAAISLLFERPSYIKKTVGIQALFGILNEILKRRLAIDEDVSVDYFMHLLTPCSLVDFSDNFYTASGLGKSRIQNTMLISLNLKSIESIKIEDRSDYSRILKS